MWIIVKNTHVLHRTELRRIYLILSLDIFSQIKLFIVLNNIIIKFILLLNLKYIYSVLDQVHPEFSVSV